MTRLLVRLVLQLCSMGLEPPDLQLLYVGGAIGFTWGVVAFVVKRLRRRAVLRSVYPNPVV